MNTTTAEPTGTTAVAPALCSTIMLVSGELDKALTAFEIAVGQASMGMRVHMWFVFYGVNCLKKPRSPFSPRKWLPRRRSEGVGRRLSTDTPLQHLLVALNRDGANHLPLSQLNFFGLGPWLLRHIMRRKGMASLEQLIEAARRLGVKFKLCQICVDAMTINIEEDLLVEAEVLGASSYALDSQGSHYNVVI